MTIINHALPQLSESGILPTMDKKHQIVLNTCPDEASARSIAGALVSKNLAACVNIVPGLLSVYVWQGQTECSTEHLLIIKTREDRYPAVEEAIQSLHPYELPEIITVPITGGLPGYLNWIDDNVAQ